MADATEGDGYGLDKGARLEAERAAVEKEAVEPLDPEWPYRAEGFDPLFFGL